MEPIGVGRRAVAVIIDSILLFIAGYAVAALTGNTTGGGFSLEGAPFFLWVAIALAYYIVMEKISGATLGKMAMKLKVVKQGGEPLDWQASVVRNVLRLVDGLFFYLVAAVTVWLSKSKQRLGDMAAHTHVVRAPTWAPLLCAALLAAGAGGEAQAATPKYTQIAVKTQVAPPDYKIDSSELVAHAGANDVVFSFSKPDAGWPEGDYRVDLFIDGKPAAKATFKVAK